VLVVGGQTLCLLLTLLAVPVFYSLFDDLARSRVWSRIGGGFSNTFGRARRRAATAAASLLGPIFRILLIATALLVLLRIAFRLRSLRLRRALRRPHPWNKL